MILITILFRNAKYFTVLITFFLVPLPYCFVLQGGPKKTGPFLRVYNFARVGARNACDMSKFSKFYLEKNIKLACQCV